MNAIIVNGEFTMLAYTLTASVVRVRKLKMACNEFDKANKQRRRSSSTFDRVAALNVTFLLCTMVVALKLALAPMPQLATDRSHLGHEFEHLNFIATGTIP